MALVEAGIIGLAILAVLAASIYVPFVMNLDVGQIFNFFEALLWISISLALAYRSARNGEFKTLLLGASLSFFIFGISDFIEMQTGAWYTPWTLFALKAACVISFVIHLVIYSKRNRKNSG